ncbi:MAG: hypothetical protein IV088_16925 [Hydrogenophaga sp.]|uniref:hypothetical protein n=1 Tax=Hydrogenophaga sp. TaxID=1904254 RepID=UPI0025BB7248|nr:hypothetical protein [Hydrogenophaga sp.]MBT9552537.1 hypothetical protein [Hydrogenophaga sp.]
MRRRFFGSFLLVALLLGGCASIDTAAVKSRTDNKKLVVASTVDSKLTLLWVGTTVFNNEQQVVDKPELGLPASLTQHVAKKLQASGRLANVAVSAPRTGDRSEIIKAAGPGADLALLLSNGVAPDPLYQTTQVMQGFGVFQRSALGMTLNSLPHAAIKAELIDLRSGETIATYTTSSFELQKKSLGSGAVIDADKVDMVQQSLTRLTDQASSELLKAFGLL